MALLSIKALSEENQTLTNEYLKFDRVLFERLSFGPEKE